MSNRSTGAARLLAVACTSLALGGAAHGVDVFLYATSIPNVADWNNESFALGDAGGCTSQCPCTSANASVNASGTGYMTATNLESFTLPANHKIVAVRVNALVRFDNNESGEVRLRVTLPSIGAVFSRDSGTFTSNTECDFEFTIAEGDITNEVAWTQALVNDIQLGIRRLSSNPATGNELKCDALRVRVITALDSDGDGVVDSSDNCDFTFNPDQTDSDGDGVGNACDNCPSTFNPDQADSNGNGVGNACEPPPICGGPNSGDCCVAHGTPGCNNASCCNAICGVDPFCCNNQWDDVCAAEAINTCAACAAFDGDGDGVPDAIDNCDNVFNPNQLDSDGDGIGNACDPCPFNSSPQMAAPTVNFIGGGAQIIGQSSWPGGTSSNVKTVPTSGGGGSGSGTTGSGLPGYSVGGQAQVVITVANDDGIRVSNIDITSSGSAFSDCAGCFANIFAEAQSIKPQFSLNGYAILDTTWGDDIFVSAVSGQIVQFGFTKYLTPGTYELSFTTEFASAPGTYGFSYHAQVQLFGLYASDDPDNDGIPNCLDNCPLHSNSNQANSDGDAFGNACDSCPNDPLKSSPGTCGCGVSDVDSDGDGTPNCADGCPSDPFKTSPGTCGCGVADTDNDGDGVPNCIDSCPNDPLKTAPGTCGCGVSDADSDGDGVANCNDQCPGKNDTIDCDGNGVKDCLQVLVPGADVNLNGVPDVCECLGNLNGDTVVNSTDLAIFLGAWGSCTGGSTDLNGDGCTNAADLSVLLGNWGPCP